MVPWAYVLDDLKETLHKTQEAGGLALGHDPISMREISAMADYNLARSRNLYGGLKNAFDQRRAQGRFVPAHMMPDYMTWLKYTQPAAHYHLYGPDPIPSEPLHEPRAQPRMRDTRGLSERRAGKKTVVIAERVNDVKMPPVDNQGRVRHHHTYEEPKAHSYRVHTKQHTNQIPTRAPGPRSREASEAAERAAKAAEKRRRQG